MISKIKKKADVTRAFIRVIIAFFVFLQFGVGMIAEAQNPIIPTEAGVYPVQIYDPITNEQIEIAVTVLFPRTIVSEKYAEAIDASDFQVEEGIFDMLTDSEIIELSRVRAWETKSGNPLEVVVVSKEKKHGNSGLYSVKFQTKNKTSIEIQVLEVQKKTLVSGFFGTEYYLGFQEYSNYSQTYFLIFFVTVIPIIILGYFYLRSYLKIRKVSRLLYSPKNMR
ncbi:hypothetical protein AwErysi_08200 [Erysipelotrichaceae bacterium]|nr:hypothetical protein AwErysi_08200 [Erysipelotrichaceae bacterium]